LGTGLFTCLLIAAWAGVLVRVFADWLRKYDWQRTTIAAVHALVVVPPLGYWISIPVKSEWSNRGPTTACSSTVFQVNLPGVLFAVPASRLFSVQIGFGRGATKYNMVHPKQLRELCEHHDTGLKSITADILHFNFNNFSRTREESCSRSSPVATRELCAKMEGSQAAPMEVHVYNDGDARPGQIVTNSSPTDWLIHTKNGYKITRGTPIAANGTPLTTFCGDHSDRCYVITKWRDNLSIQYTLYNRFHEGYTLQQSFERSDAWFRDFLEKLIKPK
jgi:hypothetical protein